MLIRAVIIFTFLTYATTTTTMEATTVTVDMNNVTFTKNFIPGFVSSLSVTILSELGDKTFFIAAILAMKESRITVFLGCITALVLMTVLSVGLGMAANFIPQIYTHYLSIVLFAVFGLKMIYDAWKMSPSEALDEYNETEKEMLLDDEHKTKRNCANSALLSGVFWQSLTMTFLAEWGDRSQISTVLLAARNNIFAVTIGTIVGHSLCTCLAVMAGRIIAHRISVKTVTYIGGLVFIGCAVFELATGLLTPEEIS